jgi:cation transport ATPase
MSEVEQRLKDLEREIKESAAVEPASAQPTPGEPKARHRRALRRRTKQKILVGVALVLAFFLVWKKVHIHFVVFTSFWGFLGILGAVFVIVYLALRFFFADKEE